MKELRSIRSEIRFRIVHLFEQAGIVIAFPQRDVHLDTLKPLEVRLRRDPADPSTIHSNQESAVDD